MGFPTKNDHFGVFWGYHHLRKHPYRQIFCKYTIHWVFGYQILPQPACRWNAQGRSASRRSSKASSQVPAIFSRHFLWLPAVDWIPKEEWPKERDVLSWETKNENCKLRKKEVTLGLVCRSDMFEGNGCVGYSPIAFLSLLFNQPPLCVFRPTFDLNWFDLNDLSFVSILKSVCHIFPKSSNNHQKRRYNKKNLGSEQKSLWFLLESHHLQRLASVNQDKCDTYPDYSDMYLDVKQNKIYWSVPTIIFSRANYSKLSVGHSENALDSG